MMEKSLEVLVNEAKEKKESEAGMGISIQSNLLFPQKKLFP